jgi:hypothetical protein
MPAFLPTHNQGLDAAGHFRTRGLANVGAEMSLHVLAYLKRAIAILGASALMAAMRG